jgi:hypothetical protein
VRNHSSISVIAYICYCDPSSNLNTIAIKYSLFLLYLMNLLYQYQCIFRLKPRFSVSSHCSVLIKHTSFILFVDLGILNFSSETLLNLLLCIFY